MDKAQAMVYGVVEIKRSRQEKAGYMAKNHVEALAKGVAEQAMAAGLEAAVAVMQALADHAVRGKVDASEIRAAAATLEATAERKRTAAEAVLRRYNAA